MSAAAKTNFANPWIWLGLLAGIAALFGGSSRPDTVQIAALRPLVALMLIPAFYYLSMEQLGRAKPLVIMLGLLTLWMIIQLIPLPHAIWQTLPARETIAELDRLLTIEDTWRPISWVPSRGWNALASMVVPIAGLLLALAVKANARMLLLIIVGIGLFDALLALLQVASGRSGLLYFYAVTNRTSPVGMFANENHSAVFSAIVMLVIARLATDSRRLREPAWLRLSYIPAFIIVLLAVLVSGSRAGLAMGGLALLAAGAMIWMGISRSRRGRRDGKLQRWLVGHPRTLLLLFSIAIIALLSAFFGLDRAPGLSAFLSQNAFEDLRFQILPILEQMVRTYWLLGIGFGSFEGVYHIYEPTALMFPSYVNQAHNDWAQLIIEGGLPVAGILIFLFLWIANSIRDILLNWKSPLIYLIFWMTSIAIICAASVVDYPLRVPVFQLVMVWLVLALALERHEKQAL